MNLELDITYSCPVRCPNCNRLCNVRPGQPDQNITPTQIQTLIEESLACHYPWQQWWLLGGEPTTHPQLWEILQLVDNYRQKRGDETFQVGIVSNGWGKRTQEILGQIYLRYPWIQIRIDAKQPGQNPHFVPVLLAPIDHRQDIDWSTHQCIGCPVAWQCGLGMNYAGFFPCCVAGAFYRVAGIGKPWKTLADITKQAILDAYQCFCRLCGFYTGNPACPPPRTPESIISPTWQQLLQRSV